MSPPPPALLRSIALNWLSLSSQGLNLPQKRSKVYPFLHSHKIDIACLQETHFASSSVPPFYAYNPQIYHASATIKRCGVMAAFHIRVPFTCRRSIADPQGLYILLLGTLKDTGNYAPNERELPFLSHFVCCNPISSDWHIAFVWRF